MDSDAVLQENRFFFLRRSSFFEESPLQYLSGCEFQEAVNVREITESYNPQKKTINTLLYIYELVGVKKNAKHF